MYGVRKCEFVTRCDFLRRHNIYILGIRRCELKMRHNFFNRLRIHNKHIMTCHSGGGKRHEFIICSGLTHMSYNYADTVKHVQVNSNTSKQ